jgi:hypothetical protein
VIADCPDCGRVVAALYAYRIGDREVIGLDCGHDVETVRA